MNNQMQLSFEGQKILKIENNVCTIDETSKNDRTTISAAKAMKMLDLSRHAFEKIVQQEIIKPIVNDGKKVYSVQEINTFMNSEEYDKLINGTVDPRNQLNDLTGKDWLPETKSFFYQKGLGANHPEAQIEKLHPAPYSFQDIAHLVKFFTKAGMRVLDPFGGVGSTAKACEVTGRVCTSMYNAGLFYRRMNIWYYENGFSRTSRAPLTQYEPFLWFSKSKNKWTYNVDDVRVPYKSTERLRNSKSIDVLDDEIQKLADANGMQANSVRNLTRFVISALEYSGWFEKKNLKLYGKSSPFLVLTQKGYDTVSTIENSYNLKGDDAVLKCRKKDNDEEIVPLVICWDLPNKRTDYWNVVTDVKNILGLKIKTISILALALHYWTNTPINLQDDDYYLEYANCTMHNAGEMLLNAGLSIDDYPGYFAPFK